MKKSDPYYIKWNHSRYPNTNYIGESGPWPSLKEAKKRQKITYALFTKDDKEKNTIVVIWNHKENMAEQKHLYARFIYTKYFLSDSTLN